MMPLTDSMRRVIPVKWVIACVIAWSLFAAIISIRTFIVNPMFSTVDEATGIPELSGVSTVLIGAQSSYLRFDQSEIDCRKLEKGNAIQCQSKFEGDLLTFTVSRRSLGDSESYTGSCRGIYADRGVSCSDIPGKSRNILPIVIDGRLGLSDERWNELYQDRGYVMSNFDLEHWVPLIVLGFLLLTGVLIWRQECRAYVIAKSKQQLSIHATRMIIKVGLATFMLCAICLALFMLVWNVEDFVTKL